MRDFLFEESTGYYQVDKPSDWAWGSGELDAPFVIVRTADPAFLDGVDQLRSRKLKLATKLPSAADSVRKGKVVQLELPRFARPESHFETRAGSTKKRGA